MSATDAAQTKGRRGRRPALDPEVERRALLDAGLTVLRRSGYERATLDEVLAESGLGTRAFYRHFETKDELLCAIYRREAESAVQRLTKRVAAATGPLEALTAWIEDTVSIAFRPGRASRARLLRAGGATRAVGYEVEHERTMRAWAAPLVPVLEEGRRRGIFPDAEPTTDANTINAIVWSVIAGFAEGDPRLDDADKAVAHVLRFALRAIGHRG